VVGRNKGFDDGSGKVYRFKGKTKDAWANLFEYTGSGENVRLRFSVEKVGVRPEDVFIVFGNEKDTNAGSAWERFINSLNRNVKEVVQKTEERDEAQKRVSEQNVALELSDLLKRPGGIEKIPLKTRLELIARLAMAPDAVDVPVKPSHTMEGDSKDLGFSGVNETEIKGSENAIISKMFLESISRDGSDKKIYAAPELKDGSPPSPRSEVYALGVLLYQVVVGDLSRPLDEDWQQSVSDDILREDIAACVERLPEKRLATPLELSRRLRTLDERRSWLFSKSASKTEKAYSTGRRKKRWIAYSLALAVILALLVWPAWYYQKVNRVEAAKKKAYENNLPKIRQLLEDEKYLAAHVLARETERIIPHDPTLQQYIKDATNTFDIESMPAGARVSYRPYDDVNSPWVDLGVTPIKKAMIPVSMTRFRIKKEGYAERELVRPVVPRDSLGYIKFREISDPFQFNLYEKGRVPDGMVPVDGGRFKVPIKGVRNKLFTVDGPFFIDRFEVTNRAYKKFMDAGGYDDPRYWKEAFKKDGQVISFAEAIKAFVDRTGRPGPANWELGNYPEGRDDYPVSGISWYEAAAYARFCGKTLPTIYHWARALFPKNEFFTPLTPRLIPQSNIKRTAVAAVGSYPGIGSSGARDMAGNVREWCWNASGESRYCLGGWWHDPAYVVTDSCVASAWDRSQGNGVRCVLYPEDAQPSETHLKSADLRFHDPYTIPPRTKESLATLKTMFAYDKGPLHPVVESRKPGGKGWVRETVTIDAAYGGERLIIHLDLPDHCKPPYKAVIYWPGASALYYPEFSRNFLWEPWDLIPKNGRALISPIYRNCFERGGGKPIGGKKSRIQRWFDRMNDLRRTIDYLETRKDIDTRSLAFLGLCWGGLEGPKISPYEERIKTLILVSGAIYIPIAYPKPKALTQAMTKVPVLMLNGKYDFIFPVKSHQKPLFDLIATPPEHKKHVIYDCGHLPLPRAPMMKEIFDWLEKYQGPVNCGPKQGVSGLIANKEQ
jgi:formylglycine-generating enzyme required for sulfatase activity/pimeloyl-ACP methyl ester carboxylesterase